MAPVVDAVLETVSLTAGVQPASSAVLAKQILNGAPAGLFISAHPQWMDEVEKASMLVPGTRRLLAGNDIVLVAKVGRLEPFTLSQATILGEKFTGRIAIGDPEHVPAGRYAREALQGLGLWAQIEDRLAPALDARAALLAVEIGAVDLGLVYKTDALSAEGLHIVAEFPVSARPSIRYELALIEGANETARQIYASLLAEAGRSVLSEMGFILPPQ